VVVERLRLRQLRWGSAADCAALAQGLGQFDIVLGADVVYVESAVPQLFASIALLLQRSSQVLCDAFWLHALRMQVAAMRYMLRVHAGAGAAVPHHKECERGAHPCHGSRGRPGAL
jgi:hypothetical protein